MPVFLVIHLVPLYAITENITSLLKLILPVIYHMDNQVGAGLHRVRWTDKTTKRDKDRILQSPVLYGFLIKYALPDIRLKYLQPIKNNLIDDVMLCFHFHEHICIHRDITPNDFGKWFNYFHWSNDYPYDSFTGKTKVSYTFTLIINTSLIAYIGCTFKSSDCQIFSSCYRLFVYFIYFDVVNYILSIYQIFKDSI